MEDSTSSLIDPYTYHPNLRPLYQSFIETLYSICAPFTNDPQELAYIAAARWPGFVKPVLDAYRGAVEEYHIAGSLNRSHGANGDAYTSDGESSVYLDQPPSDDPPQLLLPSEDVRIRLTRLFTPTFTAAMESLYPRLDTATRWAHVHIPPDNLLEMDPAQVSAMMRATGMMGVDSSDNNEVSDSSIEDLPRMAKFVLVAAFLASTNPPTSDMRMFGRGPDERAKRRRRKGGTPRKPKTGSTGGAVKVINTRFFIRFC